jgi:sugar/nucleoside kinase (ribokinase family)
MLDISDILFVNKEEGEKITKSTTEIEEMKQLLNKLQQLGPKIVVVTDGKHGSYALDNDGKMHHQKIVDGEVVEKTGAGDSFAAGFLAATVYDYDIQTAMLWGAVNAASVIGKVGAQPGLLHKDAMERKIRGL